MKALEARNCLITGASRGLGAAIASAFWSEGANLILVSRSSKALKGVQACLTQNSGQKLDALEADLSASDAAERIIAASKRLVDHLDVMVNNAGIQGPIGFSWENDWGDWQQTLQVNLLAPVALCRHAVEWMKTNHHGKIINLSGGGANGPRPRFSAYATSKAALVRFSETLAEETREYGIDVNCIAPGPMNTRMLDEIVNSGQQAGAAEYEAALKVRREEAPSIERASNLAVFLASSASDGITGRLISAKWDPWQTLPTRKTELANSDIYTLRRIVPEDRGRKWTD